MFLKKLTPIIAAFENNTGLDVKVSGMPYIRTKNSQNIIDEIQLFVGGALLITSIIFSFSSGHLEQHL